MTSQAGNSPLDTFQSDLLSGIDLSQAEFDRIVALVYEKFGINLTENKKALVKGRLMKLLKEGGFRTFTEYLAHVEADTSGFALSEMVNRISTNYTYFMREEAHFEFLTGTILPEIEEAQAGSSAKKLRIWSAGCSSGEEPYTIAMAVSEYFGSAVKSWDVGILATDISSKVLDCARAGFYPADSTRILSPALLKKYFTTLPDGTVAVSENLKKQILFKRLNLIKQDYPLKGLFNVIFCRNVMIYFDAATRVGLSERFYRFMEPGGYLLIGHSESLDRRSTRFSYIKPAIYKK